MGGMPACDAEDCNKIVTRCIQTGFILSALNHTQGIRAKGRGKRELEHHDGYISTGAGAERVNVG